MDLEFAFVIDLKIIIYLFFSHVFYSLEVCYIYYKKEHIQEILYDNVTIILGNYVVIFYVY